MGDTLKVAGSFLLGIVVLVALLAIPVLFLTGAEWLSEKLLPWFVLASILSFVVLILVLLPLSLFQRSRVFASPAILTVSHVFGATVWMEGLLLTMRLWGTVAVVVGLILMGIGVVPIAMLATLFKGMWAGLAELVVLTVLTFGTRFFALWLGEKAGATPES